MRFDLTKIENVLNDDVIEEHVSLGSEMLVAINRAKIYGGKVYIWGADDDVYTLIRRLINNGLSIYKIIDDNPEKIGKEIRGIRVISPIEFEQQKEAENSFVFIYSSLFDGSSAQLFTSIMYRAKIRGYYVIPVINRYICSMVNDSQKWIESNRAEYYMQHAEDIKELAKNLDDDVSYETLCGYIQSYMKSEVYRGKSYSEMYKYFMDDENTPLYKLLDDEVWINCGSATGDTFFEFLSLNLKAKRICLVEGDKERYNQLLKNTSMLSNERMKNVYMYNEFINNNTDFSRLLGGEKLTLLNADIEGAELDLLKSSVEVIKRDRPVIAICVYHLKEDLVEIPQYLGEHLEDYTYKLRKYSCWFHNVEKNQELVLYCIPNERICI